jgi:hypothetical protein
MNLSKIKKLYTNGSSITWGWPLHEERIKKAYSKIGIDYKNREDVIWPTLLANNLKLELVEDSRWGGSVDRLIRKTYEYCFKNFDKLNETLFVLELPIGFRTELFSNTLNRIINITRGNIENPIDATESADYIDIYHHVRNWFGEFGSTQFQYDSQSLKLMGLISFLELNKVQYLIIDGGEYQENHDVSYKIKDINKKLNVDNKFVQFDGGNKFCVVDWYKNFHKKTLKDEIGYDDYHPGIGAHRLIAEYLTHYVNKWPNIEGPLDSKNIFKKLFARLNII